MFGDLPREIPDDIKKESDEAREKIIQVLAEMSPLAALTALGGLLAVQIIDCSLEVRDFAHKLNEGVYTSTTKCIDMYFDRHAKKG